MSSIGISIILPTLNEEENLSKIIPEIISKFKKNNLDYEIVVVDDNSSDNSIDTIKKFSNVNIIENKVDIDSIQTIVCKYFKISKNEMLSPRRSRYLVRPRQTAIYLAKMLTSKSLPEIGRSFANRDHTTVIHAVKTITRLSEQDDEMKKNINQIKDLLLEK